MSVQAQTQKILITNNIGRQYWLWDSDSFYTQRLRAGPYQKQNLLHLRELCPNPRTILDIGMNIGMNTWRKELMHMVEVGYKPSSEQVKSAMEYVVKTKDEYEYLHRGLARRDFERRFTLVDHIEVVGASIKDGILNVELKREIPEALKPRKIAISAS